MWTRIVAYVLLLAKNLFWSKSILTIICVFVFLADILGEGFHCRFFERHLFYVVISTIWFGENSLASRRHCFNSRWAVKIWVSTALFSTLQIVCSSTWGFLYKDCSQIYSEIKSSSIDLYFLYLSIYRGSNGMLYTFYSVARREHIVGLWRGLVPVSSMFFIFIALEPHGVSLWFSLFDDFISLVSL